MEQLPEKDKPMVVAKKVEESKTFEITITIDSENARRNFEGTPTFEVLAMALYELEMVKQELLNMRFDDGDDTN